MTQNNKNFENLFIYFYIRVNVFYNVQLNRYKIIIFIIYVTINYKNGNIIKIYSKIRKEKK